jgi:hypothetical protein
LRLHRELDVGRETDDPVQGSDMDDDIPPRQLDETRILDRL